MHVNALSLSDKGFHTSGKKNEPRPGDKVTVEVIETVDGRPRRTGRILMRPLETCDQELVNGVSDRL